MLHTLLLVLAGASPPASDPLITTMTGGVRQCLSLSKQAKFDDKGFVAAGWTIDSTPAWYKANAAERTYGTADSDTVLSVHGANLFPLIRVCSVEAPLPPGTEVRSVADAVSASLNYVPADTGQIKLAPDEFFFGGRGKPTMAISMNKASGKKTVRTVLIMK